MVASNKKILNSLEYIGDWETFEIYRLDQEIVVYLYKTGCEKMLDCEVDRIGILSECFPTLRFIKKVEVENRVGFIAKLGEAEVMLVSIRNKPDKSELYACLLGEMLVKLHRDIKLENVSKLNLPNLKDYYCNKIKELSVVSGYKENLLEMHESICYEPSLCHNDLGPYHILFEDEEPFVFCYESLAYGDAMGDLAKSIFWLCSNYVPYFGPYLFGREKKETFIRKMLDTYKCNQEFDEERLLKWLVIYAAIEYNTEMLDEEESPDLVLLYEFVKDYFSGKQVNYFDYLICEKE